MNAEHVDLSPLWEAVGQQFRLDVDSAPGPRHWAKVESYALRLASETNADRLVVRLFAVLHDSQRQDDGIDPDHGIRAAALAGQLRGRLFDLNHDQFLKLEQACAGHASGQLSEDLTIGTCWDADRLDLVRNGIWPKAEHFSTPVARQLVADEGRLRLFLRA